MQDLLLFISLLRDQALKLDSITPEKLDTIILDSLSNMRQLESAE